MAFYFSRQDVKNQAISVVGHAYTSYSSLNRTYRGILHDIWPIPFMTLLSFGRYNKNVILSFIIFAAKEIRWFTLLKSVTLFLTSQTVARLPNLSDWAYELNINDIRCEGINTVHLCTNELLWDNWFENNQLHFLREWTTCQHCSCWIKFSFHDAQSYHTCLH